MNDKFDFSNGYNDTFIAKFYHARQPLIKKNGPVHQEQFTIRILFWANIKRGICRITLKLIK